MNVACKLKPSVPEKVIHFRVTVWSVDCAVPQVSLR